ncbi:MAG: outer membrane lipoprotein-sorting protein [Bacteriovoracaceae bacterium]|nr:outer membrane lipoprotein-sorting protein [Bacteriovoracaceae bacterium]
MKLLLFTLFLLSPNLYAVTLNELLDKVDKLYRSDKSYSDVQMEITTPNWKRTLSMDIWTKGLDYTFVVIKKPRKDKGISTLKRKSEMWNFFPKINKIMKIPPSMMMSSWMGSDFTNDDLVKENTLRDDYNGVLTPVKKGDTLYHAILTPKKNAISVWGRIELEINKKDLYPVRQIFYDEKGIMIRTISFTDIKKSGNRLIPMTMILTPHTKEKDGHKTIIRYIKLDFNAKISDSLFTRRNLQKRR